MPTHGQVAKQVRLDKERHPEKYCDRRDCLWRKQFIQGHFICPKHGQIHRA